MKNLASTPAVKAFICAFGGVTAIGAPAAGQELKPVSDSIVVEPVRIAVLDENHSMETGWIDYEQAVAQRGGAPCGQDSVLVYDAFQPDSAGNPTGADTDCGLAFPDSRYRRESGGVPSVCHMRTVDDFTMATGYQGGEITRALGGFYWYGDGNPANSEQCYVVIQIWEDIGSCPNGPAAEGFLGSVIVDLGVLPTNPGFYYVYDVDLCAALGSGIPAPVDGQGAFDLILAQEFGGGITLATCAQPILWGTAGDRPGSQDNAPHWEDRDGSFTLETGSARGECFTLAGFAACPDTIGSAVALYGVGRGEGGAKLHKLLADDGAAGDIFGHAVAMSGGLALVGAPLADSNGISSGAAYVFDPTTGQQLFELVPDDGAAGDSFGLSVAVSGDLSVVGATGGDDNGLDSGSAYVFDATTGQQLFKLLPDDGSAGDIFGASAAMSGDLVVMGAPMDADNGDDSGSAYAFGAITGQQLFKLLPDDGAAGDTFGHAVAMSGGLVLVGVRFDDDNGTWSGSAYVFDATTGQQLFKLLPDDGAAGDLFGNSVAMSGDLAVIGAPFDDDNGITSGSAYVFNGTTGQQLFKLLPGDGAEGDRFGESVALSGDLVVVGSAYDDDNGSASGSAYTFSATAGQQLFKLLPGDGAADDRFGDSVALSADLAVVGTRLADDQGTDSGSACVFKMVLCAVSDLNNDDTVDTADLGILIGQFGSAGPEADLNGDGIVDTADLGILIGQFGTDCAL